jgi:hypothetical protein
MRQAVKMTLDQVTTYTAADLASSPLVIDALYRGGTSNNVSDDPIAQMLPVGNSGGIRYRGPRTMPTILALLTSGADIDWPDHFDPENGVFTYFGDNKTEGKDLHDTPRGGNLVLRNIFDASQGGPSMRALVPPTFVFRRDGLGRTYRFLGLAVPGSADSEYFDDLVAVWRTRNGLRFQNYRATFTVLDVPEVSRAWVDDLIAGTPLTTNAPNAWRTWVAGGPPKALLAPRSLQIRTKADQEPTAKADKHLLSEIHQHFAPRPQLFEFFAADIARLFLPSMASIEVTRPSRDGGRDAIGKYRVGSGPGSIVIDFALEAKCYAPENSVGVREVSRLISRLRHRQFGVLVTTSYVHAQAYSEIIEDGHPIIVLSGRDIAEVLRKSDIPIAPNILPWLAANYPVGG